MNKKRLKAQHADDLIIVREYGNLSFTHNRTNVRLPQFDTSDLDSREKKVNRSVLLEFRLCDTF
jgi:hypothetical protein